MDRRKVLVETLPVLFLCVLGGSLAGFFLGSMADVFELIPGLIIIVPAIIDMRGNICSALGSRLGSALHLGLLDEGLTSDITIENFKGTISLSLFVSVLFPIFLLISSFFLPFTITFRILGVIALISIFTGVTSAIVLLIVTFGIILFSIKFNVDPDNISGPVLTTVGDIATLMIMFAFAVFFGGIFL
ncbi:MAG: magnesium transporter [Thermoplasmata archaeon]